MNASTGEAPLRSWQQEALRWALDTPGHRLIQAPPGTGKSRVGYAVAAHWLARAPVHRVFWATPSVALVDQAQAAAYRYVRTPAFAQLGTLHAPRGARFVVTTHASAARFVPQASPRDLVIFDEAHHANVEALVNFSTSQRPRQCLGLSASPWSVGMREAFPVSWIYSLSAALRDGALVPLLIRSGLPVERAPLTLHFVSRVAEAKRRARAEDGISFVAGDPLKTLTPWRQGRIPDLFVCARIGEGYDVPECARVVLHRRTQSAIWAYQAVGRVLRCRPGKSTGEAYCLHVETAAALAQALEWAEHTPTPACVDSAPAEERRE